MLKKHFCSSKNQWEEKQQRKKCAMSTGAGLNSSSTSMGNVFFDFQLITQNRIFKSMFLEAK